MQSNVIELDKYRKRPPLPSHCLRCGRPGARGRCMQCIDRLRGALNRVRPQPEQPAEPPIERCANPRCNRELEPKQRVAVSRDTGKVYCAAYCWRDVEVSP